MEPMALTLILLALAWSVDCRGLGESDDQQSVLGSDDLSKSKPVDFVGTRLSALGEVETRLAYKGIKAMEVVIPNQGEEGLFYRQITDGRRIVQMIYKGIEGLVDCDLSADETDMAHFYNRFLGAEEVFDLQKNGEALTGVNVTMRVITGDLDAELRPLSDFRTHRRQCQNFMRQIRQVEKEKKRQGRSGLFDKSNSETEASPSSPHRSKRSMFMYPGTKWCGRGSISTHFDDLGDNIATDKCCRSHDHCPYTIEGFTTSFGVFNYRFHTLSHCNCDESFRACLRFATNSVANMVGELYFNVVGTKCFTMKKEKECVERSWWGKCTRYDSTKKAYIQEPLIF